MSNLNKPIVSKAKEILKEMGYEVKTSHVYEFLSRLAGEKDWNTAKAKNVNFAETLSKINPECSKQPDNKHSELLEQELMNGNFLNQFFLSKKTEGSFSYQNHQPETDSPAVGSIGSVKTMSLRLGLTLWLASNGHNSMVFISNPHKRENEYSFLFKFKDRVVPVFNSEEQLRKSIDLIFEEAQKRMESFKELGVNNLLDYEAKTNKQLTRIFLVDANLQSIAFLSNTFSLEHKTPGATANKLYSLMRIGRSLGIIFIAEPARSTTADIPSELVATVTHKLVFKVSAPNSANLPGEANDSALPANESTVRKTENGKVKNPWLSQEEQDRFILKHYKPISSECLFITKDLISKLLI